MLRAFVLLVAAFVWAYPARGQPAYPTRPVQLVVTVPPGGAADFVARIIAAKLADALGRRASCSESMGRRPDGKRQAPH